ncbi:pyridoxal phosphate-dependent transferase [Irpex rosettiformis]|uniref:Pyridoxal phosphate-dependent transferase n=1 Tax=Irpex rosettiformis TaxID=378272 RepID=A0ACB8UG17_9APHY|nr:pyridoxal phosphate-dependent transferase [Irpex rosettiformis]
MSSHMEHIAVGEPLPLQAGKHAISVSLPSWFSHIGFKEDDHRITDLMQTGYPRFWIHWNIRKLSRYFEEKYSTTGESALLLRSASAAQECQSFLAARGVPARILDYVRPKSRPGAEVHVVFYPKESFPVAKQFWQHTGLGITTRLADYYIDLLKVPGEESAFESARIINPVPLDLGKDLTEAATKAKSILRQRIAELVGTSVESVWLYPAGMHAIWSVHQACLASLGQRKSVCFGFPYVDTLKVLEKWGPGCYFYPDGSDKFIDELDENLAKLKAENPSSPPILALFTELPSNPLLRSINLPRLRELADKYDFPIVIDDTIGNFVNVDALRYADVVASSLSKLFSGRADVMGGSLIVNPKSKYYNVLQTQLLASFEDLYFDEDVLVMEHNSRDFITRISIIDSNTEAITSYLRTCTSIVKEIYYPKWQTPEYYDLCRRTTLPDGTLRKTGGYGGLFSILFVSVPAAKAFFDALPCPKGPSFGTDFTLVCPYAIIAHYRELEWAKAFGVPLELVRVWVGMESLEVLMEAFREAAKAAEEVQALNSK